MRSMVRWFVLALWGAFSIASPAQSTSCKPLPGDEAAVADTVRAMYKAATEDDLAGFHAVVAPGFYAYDNGRRFDGDALMKMAIALHQKGAHFVWTVSQPEVRVQCDMAWIAYVNQGSVQMSPDGGPVPMTWLESAMLQRQSGGWRLVFFHSTRAEAAGK